MEYNLEFNINYRTKAEENLAVEIFCADDLRKVIERIYLQYQDNDNWKIRCDIDLNSNKSYIYNYIIVCSSSVVVREKIYPERELNVSEKVKHYIFFDTWRWDIRQLNLKSSAFLNCIFRYNSKEQIKEISNKHTEINTYALLPQSDNYEISIVGSSPILGRWEVRNGLKLCRVGHYKYRVQIENAEQLSGTQYKYVIIQRHDGKIIWEEGNNRTFPLFTNEKKTRIDDGWIRIPQYTDWRGAGVIIPLFSIHTHNSAGIGDFHDLKQFVSWASNVGFSILQLLPINDTVTFGTWRDSYPYSIISAHAINIIYIDLRELIGKYIPNIKDDYIKTCQKLNAKNFVDFEQVLKYKNKILHEIYKNIGEQILCRPCCQKFIKSNKEWLISYAAYCSLRDKFKSVDSAQWKGFETYDETKILRNKTLLQRMQYYYFVQYLAFSQIRAVHDYAVKKGIILKGDIPIGVNANSVDVWRNPEFFHKDMSTGAPPDYFSADGQNWGFPTYNWSVMKEDGYSWWKKRLKVMSRLFDAYRIDHVLGFFRIWEIPRDEKSAKKGHFSPSLPYSKEEIKNSGFNIKEEYIGTLFLKVLNSTDFLYLSINARNDVMYRKLDDKQRSIFDSLYIDFFFKRHNNYWADGAIKKLGAITNATAMLTCAEDLGMLPDNVDKTLELLNILSLEIQNMPKQLGVEFADTSKYPYRSVATISTHDMPSFRLWWKRFPDAAKRYADKVLHTSNVPADASTDICERVIKMHLDSPSMLCLLTFQDWTSVCSSARAADISNEQINNPANPDQYWNYKTHLSIEDLEENTLLNQKIRLLLTDSNRNSFCQHFAE